MVYIRTHLSILLSFLLIFPGRAWRACNGTGAGLKIKIRNNNARRSRKKLINFIIILMNSKRRHLGKENITHVQSVPYQIGLSLRFKDKNTHIILEKPSIFCKKYFKIALHDFLKWFILLKVSDYVAKIVV